MLSWDPRLNGDPRTIKLARELGCIWPHAVGHLIALYTWMVTYAPDGCVAGLDHGAVASGAGWPGEADQFLRALLRAGWCDRNGHMAEWQAIAAGALEAQRQAEYRLLTRALYNNDALRTAVRTRDGDTCYFCQRPVRYTDKRGPRGGTYARKDPHGEWTEDNTAVSCRECASRRPVALRTPNGANGKKLTVPATASNSPFASSAENDNGEKLAVERQITHSYSPLLAGAPTASNSPSPSSPEIPNGEKLAVPPANNGKYLPFEEGDFEASLSSKPERQVIHRAPDDARTTGVNESSSSTPVPLEQSETVNATVGGPRARSRAREAPPDKGKGKGKPELELSDQQRGVLVKRWEGKFPGGGSDVGERISAAMAHASRHDWDDAFVYVNGWLKRDADRLANRTPASRAASRPATTAAPSPAQPSEFTRFRGSSR